MARFILRYRGAGPHPAGDAERIATLPGVEVIDDSPRMLLVEGPANALRAAVADMPGWVIAAERAVPLPDVRRRPRGRS
jgi:hypothetical protein